MVAGTIKLKMEKEALHSDLENNCENCSPERTGIMRKKAYCLGSFWGQLILLGILTLLFWLLFGIAGYNPSENPISSPVQCDVEKQVGQVAPVPQDQQESTSANFLFFGYIFTAIMGEDEITSNTEKSSELGTDVILMDPVLQTEINVTNKNDDDTDIALILPSPASKPDNNISLLFDLITQSLTDFEVTSPNYYISSEDERLNWFEALQACVLYDMQLVAIQTEEKNREINQMIEDEIGLAEGDFWISGTNLWTYSRNAYYWASTGTPLMYTNWHTNSPSAPTDKNCIQITNTLDSPTKGNLRWNDYGCHTKSRFICESFNEQ